jgi:enoyl-[acyl-carrier protein] reductase II
MEQPIAFETNRITRLFEIQYPLVQAGMIWCSGWRLAASVSNSGGLGLIGAGSMDAETLRLHIRKCKMATHLPFGINIPLLYRHADELMSVVVEEKVPIVFTSAGNPKTFTSMLQSHGIKVAHVVSSSKFARKVEEAGADAVVAEGFEAGGHNGREEITTLCLLPQVRKAVGIPVLAAGGIACGNSMMAAMALGADGVQIGTRFVASLESSAHPEFKRRVIQAEEGDTKLSLKAATPVRLLKNAFAERVQTAESQGASKEELLELLGRGRSKRGMFDGDLEEGELEIGQIASNLGEILPAAEIVEQIMQEYHLLKKAISGGGNRFGN